MRFINLFSYPKIIRRLLIIFVILSGLILFSNSTKADQASITISATVLSLTPAPTPTPNPSNPPAGGGGGGGLPSTGVIMSGKAYPLSKVTVLKDGQVAVTTIAGPDANFYISQESLSSGNYVFSIYGEDSKGNRSPLFTFPIYVTQGAITQITGIFLAPTIAVDKDEVKQGDNIAIFGQSAPQSEITIAVNSDTESFVKTQTDKNGVYLYDFDTSLLEIGQHLAKSKASLGNQISPFGKLVSFAVGDKTIGLGGKCGIADLNCDGRVNLVDFSILLYWWKKPNALADLNSNGLVDLPDFSIMLYWWTG